MSKATDGGEDAPPDFYTVPEAAARLKMSKRAVWRLLEVGDLERHEFGGLTRISRLDLEAYIRRSRLNGPSTRKVARRRVSKRAVNSKSNPIEINNEKESK